MVSTSRSNQVVSAGGVVYRRGEAGIEVVICGRTREGLWALPKGTPHDGESLEETALREVGEETGLAVRIEERIGEIEYEFVRPDGTRREKRVDHYLMTPVGGSLDGHDGEFDVVRWAPAEEALRLLRHPNERDILSKALRLIDRRAAG
jgi:8-oxo-dGTP pyrophosphatase MutT (NUDIX family)